MVEKRTIFQSKYWPYVFLAPQILVSVVFFFYPAFLSIWQSFFKEDPFGLTSFFSGFENYKEILTDPKYLLAAGTTLVMSVGIAVLCLVSSFLFAILANRVKVGKILYRTLLICPYAVAPAVAGVLWFFLFNPSIGYIANILTHLGISWNPNVNGTHAMILVILASSWKQISYNFLFYLASLQSLPRSIFEAAAIDGISNRSIFFHILIPLLSPITFFLFIMNMIYAFFDTFGVIFTTTQGGPGSATTNLVYKVYQDGIVGLNLGGSAAQSFILMIFISLITVFHFFVLEKKVHY